jgi:release factor glutamine methyltransferase
MSERTANIALNRVRFEISLMTITCVVLIGCTFTSRNDPIDSYKVQQTWTLQDLGSRELVQFESVFWEPDDTVSLREAIIEDGIGAHRDVLEIGTGTGLIAILCLLNHANKVVATDINPAAVANARYNAEFLLSDQELEVRQVLKHSAGAFAVVRDTESFDLIISNPPWENGVIEQPADHAFYDPGFALMDSILDGLPSHLRPGGRCLLAYGHVPAIKRLRTEAENRGYTFTILDDRELDLLEMDFLPGMLIEIRIPVDSEADSEANPNR